MILTFQRPGDLENALIEVWGVQRKAVRRHGAPMIYMADKHYMCGVDWDISISEAYWI